MYLYVTWRRTYTVGILGLIHFEIPGLHDPKSFLFNILFLTVLLPDISNFLCIFCKFFIYRDIVDSYVYIHFSYIYFCSFTKMIFSYLSRMKPPIISSTLTVPGTASGSPPWPFQGPGLTTNVSGNEILLSNWESTQNVPKKHTRNKMLFYWFSLPPSLSSFHLFLTPSLSLRLWLNSLNWWLTLLSWNQPRKSKLFLIFRLILF